MKTFIFAGLMLGLLYAAQTADRCTQRMSSTELTQILDGKYAIFACMPTTYGEEPVKHRIAIPVRQLRKESLERGAWIFDCADTIEPTQKIETWETRDGFPIRVHFYRAALKKERGNR